MNIEEILAKLKAITDAGETRSLTDDEVAEYETLEDQLKAAQKTDELRSRTAAYLTPVQTAVHVGVAKQDDTLDRAFDHYLRTGKPNQDIAELRAQQVGTDSEGGYMVSPGFRQKLVEVQKAFGGLAAEVDTFTTKTGGTIEYPTLNDTANQGGITPEEAAFVDGADLAFGTVNLGAFKYTSSGAGTTTPLRVSVELLQDAEFDVSSLIARKLGERIMRKQASDWAIGTGTTLPLGICHASLTENHALASGVTITYADLMDLEATLDPAYEQNAKWVFNKATWTAIRKVVDNDGRPIIFDQAASGAGKAPERMLLGYPVVIDQSFPNPSGDSTNFAILGDLMEAYVIRRVAPLTVVVNPYTRMNNGQVEYVAWERADGTIQNRSAYSVLATEDTA